MRSLALVCLIAVALGVSAQPTRPPTAPAPAPAPTPTATPDRPIAPAKATAEILSDPLKAGKVAPLLHESSKESVNDTSVSRYLIVAGRGEYTIWANLAQIFVSVEPRVIQAAVTGANATQQSPDNIVPDAKAKEEIRKVYEKVLAVLEKFKAINISSPPSFVSSPMFEPNVTAFRMFMEHQRQMMARRRKALSERMGRDLLLQGRPLSMHDKAFMPSGLMHRSNIRSFRNIRNAQLDEGVDPAATQQQQKPVTPPTPPAATPTPTPAVKPEEAKKEPVKPEEKKEITPLKAEEKKDIAHNKEVKHEEPMVPLPDPKSLINFKGFKFYRPLSAIVPIESVMEIAQSLRTVNATIDSVQLALSPKAFDEARGVASKAAIERALTVADAALGAAGEKRLKLNTVLISSSAEPHLPRLPMFRAAFLRPQAVPVVSQVILRVAF